MSVSHSPPEIPEKTAQYADVWGRAAAGDVETWRDLYAARLRALHAWRVRAVRAESALRAAKNGGEN